jgi:hypothetical protein
MRQIGTVVRRYYTCYQEMLSSTYKVALSLSAILERLWRKLKFFFTIIQKMGPKTVYERRPFQSDLLLHLKTPQ